MDKPEIIADFERLTIETASGDAYKFSDKDRMARFFRYATRALAKEKKLDRHYRPSPLKNPKTGKAFAWK